MTSTIGYLGPVGQTYGWQVADYLLENHLKGDYHLKPEGDQSKLLNGILTGTSDNVAAIIAYSNNLGAYGVSKIWEDITRFTRTINDGEQRMRPENLIAIVEAKIQQCLIGREGIEYGNIKNIYAHPQASNQAKIFISKNLPNARIIDTESNGLSVNLARENSEDSVAIGPSFAVNDGQTVLKKGVDNNPNSVTKFALIQNINKDRIILNDDSIENKTFGCIVYIKKKDIKTDIIVSSLLLKHGLSNSFERMSNSPTSGEAIKAIEINSKSSDNINNFLKDIKNGCPSLEISIKSDGKDILSKKGSPSHETQYLGPSSIFKM